MNDTSFGIHIEQKVKQHSAVLSPIETESDPIFPSSKAQVS